MRSTIRLRLLAIALAATAVTAACGGGDDPEPATATTGTSGGTGSDALAALGIISKDTSVRPTTTSAFRDGTDGETLAQGDTIRTSATGFAELAYFDGSFTRIDNAAELTLTKLEKTDQGRTVNTTLTSGRSCTPTTYCRFSVVDGTIVLTIPGRDPIVLTAPAQADITKDPAHTTTPRTVTLPELLIDPFTTRNLQIDTTKKLPAITANAGTTTALATTTTTPATSTTPSTAAPRPTEPPTATTQPPVATTEPPATTTPPTTAAPGLNLNGAWTLTLTDASLLQTSGCFAGAALSLSGGTYLVQGTGFGCAQPLPASATLSATCSATECTIGGFRVRLEGGALRVSRVAAPGACFAAPGPSEGTLSADERELTFNDVFNACRTDGGFQFSSLATLRRA